MFKINRLIILSLMTVCLVPAGTIQAYHNEEDKFPRIETEFPYIKKPEFRTSGRSVIYSFKRPIERQDLGSNLRTWNSKHIHPKRWDGQDWDISQWEGTGWSAETLIGHFYAAGYLANQFVDERGTPILEVGPNFYDLSYHDKRRIVTLLVNHHDVLDSRNPSVVLTDWFTKDWVGQYSKATSLRMDQEFAP